MFVCVGGNTWHSIVRDQRRFGVGAGGPVQHIRPPPAVVPTVRLQTQLTTSDAWPHSPGKKRWNKNIYSYIYLNCMYSSSVIIPKNIKQINCQFIFCLVCLFSLYILIGTKNLHVQAIYWEENKKNKHQFFFFFFWEPSETAWTDDTCRMENRSSAPARWWLLKKKKNI